MTNYEKLRGLLAELFQFDQADLDFGIYRIMNQKRDEISRFLDQDLLPQVRQALAEYQASASQAGQVELHEAIKQAQELGVDPDSSPKVQELKAKVGAAQDLAQLEDEVFSDLFGFFRRYYSEGDFISLRRYEEGVYAIPYEAEEVKLHWANHDQYYVKSSESFRNYTFRLPDGRQVHFRIVEAASARDNTKPADSKDRRFTLWDEETGGQAEEDPDGTDADILFGLGDEEEQEDEADRAVPPSFHGPAVEEVDGDLVVRFVYLPDPQKRKQAAINEATAEAVLTAPAAKAWVNGLRTGQPTEKNPNRTLLDRHLSQYTARNTFDYFIHKDLGGFLRRELDFYIKNEVVHLDDIESETAPRVEQYLGKVRRWQEIASALLRKYCDRYYKREKAAREAEHLEARELTPDDPNFVEQYRVLIDKSLEEVAQKLRDLKDAIEAGELKEVSWGHLHALVFDRHLYHPLLYIRYDGVEVSPVSLNDGERDFVLHLRDYYRGHAEFFADKELYVLRNQSRGRGIGFFEAGNFHPDFVLWLLTGERQFVTFVDPKGLRNVQGLDDPKIRFCETVKGIEERIGDPGLTLNSCIVATTAPENVPFWGQGLNKVSLAQRNVVFQDDAAYVEKLLRVGLSP